MKYQDQLKKLVREQQFFIGLDSDGCVFDTMEIKQKECFCPAVIKHFDLQSISKIARELWEFVNLYSVTRGVNRFLAMDLFFSLLRQHQEVIARDFRVPEFPALTEWIRESPILDNQVLRQRMNQYRDVGDTVNYYQLYTLYTWSTAVNSRVQEMVHGISPFPYVGEFFQLVENRADIVVISQTPMADLAREWEEHKLDSRVRVIAGQEFGTKAEQIAFATEGKGYESEMILIIGDAPGDMEAALKNEVLFYPIVPGLEQNSWKNLCREGLQRFFNGSFSGDYQKSIIDEFKEALPDKP